MSEPGGGAPAGRRSLLGDADREHLIALLREHYAAGRLDLDDLRHRVGVVLAAAYAEEAAVALADLPPSGVPDTPGAARGGGSRGRHAQTHKAEPGWVPTKMGGSGAPDDMDQAHLTQVWLALGDDPKAQVTGKYFYHLERKEPNPRAHDPALQDRLIAICAEISGVALSV